MNKKKKKKKEITVGKTYSPFGNFAERAKWVSEWVSKYAYTQHNKTKSH